MGTVVGKKNTNSKASTGSDNNSTRTSPPNTINESHLYGTDAEYVLTPAYYIKFLNKRDTKIETRSKLVSDLSVRLRTMPIK